MIPEFEDKHNYNRMQCGELYHSFAPDLLAARRKCAEVYRRFNSSGDLTRRQMVEFWNEMTCNDQPLPPPGATSEEDNILLQDFPWVEPPIHMDYGFNIETGSNVYIGFNCAILDTRTISIGSRTKIGPNVSLFGSTHPVDPSLRNGIKGPERGGKITIGEDCWIGGNVVILADVTVGKGCIVRAGSVVTKDIPPYHLAEGNPARIVRKIEL